MNKSLNRAVNHRTDEQMAEARLQSLKKRKTVERERYQEQFDLDDEEFQVTGDMLRHVDKLYRAIR